MNRIIAYFIYKRTNYFIAFSNEMRIVFFKKKKNGEFSTHLTKSEYKTVLKVYDLLRVEPEKAVFMKSINVNNNLYNVFYDIKTRNYFWQSQNGEYNIKDNVWLNFKYNHQSANIYLKNDFVENSRDLHSFYNKRIKIGQKIILLAVAATLTLNLLTGCKVQEHTTIENEEILASEIETTVSFDDKTVWDIVGQPEEKREYKWEEIKQAVESNPNISDKEKNLILSMKFVFDKDHQYMDLDMIIERLSNLQILYSVPRETLKGNVEYSSSDNIIKVSALDFDTTNLNDFIHAFSFVLRQNYCFHLLEEIVNAKWTLEVLYKLYYDDLVDKRLFLSSENKSLYDSGEFSDEKVFAEFLSQSSSLFDEEVYNGLPALQMLSDIVPQDILKYGHYSEKPTSSLCISYLCSFFKSKTDVRNSNDLMCELSLFQQVDYSSYLSCLEPFYKTITGTSITDNPEYQLLISQMTEEETFLGATFDNGKEFFKQRFIENYGCYLMPELYYFKSCFGYTNAKNMYSFLDFETGEITDELLSDYTSFISTNNEIIDVRRYEWGDIKKSIECNSDLSADEKNILYKLKFVFDENNQYLDLDLITLRLATLKINYVDGHDTENPTFGGCYSPSKNEINMYRTGNISEANIEVLLHEIFHVLQSEGSGFLYELSNEAFIREVLRRLHALGELDDLPMGKYYPTNHQYGIGYQLWMPIYYYLADLIPQEVLKEFQFTRNESIIVDALCMDSVTMEKDKQLAWQLIDAINATRGNSIETAVFGINPDKENDVKKKIKYFYDKKGKSLDSEINLLLYEYYIVLHQDSLLENDLMFKYLEKSNNEYYVEDLLFWFISRRSYFSHEFPQTQIHLYTKTSDFVIPVDEAFYSDYLECSQEFKTLGK